MVDFEADAEVRKAGWNGFCKFLTYSTVLTGAALVLMAIFLL